jgi:hypothetical protein
MTEQFPQEDQERADKQREKVFALMRDGQARTLEQIAREIGAPSASIPAISARLRDARKKRYGSRTVEKKRIRPGLYAYWFVVGE